MLYLYESQRLEVLSDLLVDRLGAWAREGVLDPLVPETVIPQNPVIGRWLAVRISERTGIYANLSFPLAGRFIRELLEPFYGDPLHPAHFEKETLLLRLFEILPALLSLPTFEPVRGFLGRESPERRRYDLSVLLSELYDRSMIYRPELLLSWEKGGETEYWPAILWRHLAGNERPRHRARMMEAFFLSEGRALTGSLPARISLFGLTGMAPRDLHFFRTLGEAGLCDLHLYFLNPCEEYWGDIVTPRVRERAPVEKTPYLATGSPLLSSWGQQFRTIHQMLSDLPQSCRLFPPSRDSLLGRVQEDIRSFLDRGALVREGLEKRIPIPRNDRSIEVVRCPSPVREIEMLKDHLLDLFSEIPDLLPEDVVILAPDIARYAGIIRSVFGVPEENEDREGKKRDPEIPFVISDRRELLEDPLFDALLLLLRLPEMRLTAPIAFRLLSLPSISRRFGLSEVRLSRLQEILKNAGFRWGRHGEDRPVPYAGRREHSLSESRDRLLLGYACGEEVLPRSFNRPDPYFLFDDPEGVIAGGIAGFLEALDDLTGFLEAPILANHWPERLSKIIDAFFDLDPSDGMVLELLSLPERMRKGFSTAGFEAALSAGVAAQHLERLAASGDGRDRFFAGGVTFGRMVPLRSLPFRVVCLIGMNDADFPRSSWPPSFDWLAAHPEPGDRSLREDDRTLFLEAVLSSRDCLWISFVGVEIRDGSPREPSVLVRQFLDVLNEGFEGHDGPIAGQISLDAPIDPLSPVHYQEGADIRLRSYSRSWHEALTAAISQTARDSIFFDPSLSLSGTSQTTDPFQKERLAIADLRTFIRNPVRYFLTRRMGLPPSEQTLLLEEDEPFVPGESRFLSQALRDSVLSANDLPWPPLRKPFEEGILKARDDYRAELSWRTGIDLLDKPEDLPRTCLEGMFRGMHVFGAVEGLIPTREGGRILIIERWPWPGKPQDFLEAFLLHLLGSLFIAGYEGCVLTVRGTEKDETSRGRFPLGLWRWSASSVTQASRHFLSFVRAFKKGGAAPLSFDPLASEAFVAMLHKNGTLSDKGRRDSWNEAKNKARSVLRSSRLPSIRSQEHFSDPRKHSSFWSSLAFSGRDLPGEFEFALWSLRLWGPIFEGRRGEGDS